MSFRDHSLCVASVASCALLMAAGSAQAGFNVSVGIEPGSVMFFPSQGNPYYMYASINVGGFTDSDSLENRASLVSSTGAFESQQGVGGFTSSILYDSLSDLKAAALAGLWSLSITDGATAQTFHYSVAVDPTNLTGEFVRRITMVGEGTDGVISNNPTFHWVQDSTDNAGAQYDQAYAQLYNYDTNQNINTPGILLTDSQWTPDGAPFPAGHFAFAMSMYNTQTPRDLVTASLVLPALDGEIDSFDYSVQAVSTAYLSNLYAPTPGAATLLGAAGLMSAARRRRVSQRA